MQRKIFLIVTGILILILSIVGLTYAFMRPQVEKKEEKSNITINACAKIQLKDNGSFINLENSYPMDDEMGLKTKPYEFTITSTCEDYVGFNLYLTSLTTNEIIDNNIHFAITDKNKEILREGILGSQKNGELDFNSEELKELDKGIKGEHKNIYKVYSEDLALKENRNYRLYIWLDKDANNATMGNSFKVGLSVKSYSRKETVADVCLGKTVECLIQNVNLDSTLYYHNTELENGAQDDSYRYAGSSEEVKNYVCLDGKATNEGACANGDADLYRIIGLFKNANQEYEIKLIKYDYATSEQLGKTGAYKATYNLEDSFYKGNKKNLPNIGGYYWTSSNNNVNEWLNSELRKTNLNDYYLNVYLKIDKNVDTDKLIATHTWSLNGHSDYQVPPKVMYDNEMNKVESDSTYPTQTKEVQDKIGLIYVSDYGYAASPSNTNKWTKNLYNYNADNIPDNNWMYMGLQELTISRNSSLTNYAFRINTTGGVLNYSPVSYDGTGVRPSFYITFNTKIKSGDGSKEKPYRITFE